MEEKVLTQLNKWLPFLPIFERVCFHLIDFFRYPNFFYRDLCSARDVIDRFYGEMEDLTGLIETITDVIEWRVTSSTFQIFLEEII